MSSIHSGTLHFDLKGLDRPASKAGCTLVELMMYTFLLLIVLEAVLAVCFMVSFSRRNASLSDFKE